MPSAKPQPWEQLADPETGQLVTRVPFDALFVTTSVEVDSGNLVFNVFSAIERIRVPADLLEKFLGAKTDERRHRFAQRFGALLEPSAAAYESGRHREPFEIWDRFQWEFSYLLGLVAAVREGADVVRDPADDYAVRGLRIIRGGTLSDLLKPRTWRERSRAERRELAAAVIQQRTWFLVNISRLRPGLVAERTLGKFRFVLQGGNHAGTSLLGAITGQFLVTATGSGFASCSACGNVFVPKRRQPAFGKRRYCAQCGRTAALRHAKAEYRKREREKRLAQKGAL